MDDRLLKLTEWQLNVYQLCWKVGASKDKLAGVELDRLKKEHPKEYQEAFNVWLDIMSDVMF